MREHKPTGWSQSCKYDYPKFLSISNLWWHKKFVMSDINFFWLCHQSDVPQFVVFTADDAVQQYTLDAVNQFLAHRTNPNGCPVKMTYYTSLNYTNYTLVTDWFVAGNEIADHTYGVQSYFCSYAKFEY